MDANILLGGLGVVLTTSGLVYAFLRNFKDDIHKEIGDMKQRQELMDDRLFKLAMGQSLHHIMKEERQNKKD